MKVLIVGGGGREHAIAWKVAESPLVDKVYCAPGNAGIEEVAECVPIGAMEFDKLVAFAKEKAIDLTVIGMDDPLVGGIVDAFEAEGLRVFGPRKNAAIIEGSKAFSKDLMKKYGIPTAAYENFTDPQAALDYLETAKMPIVLKADGLALGKGVLICQNLEEARAGVKEIMEDKKFGSAGNQMVVEEFMTGREVSALCFCDGTNIVPMTSAQDHKRAKDGDQGLNTGGMGTFSPSPFYTEEVNAFCMEHIFKPTMAAMKAEGRDFVGILFVGLMLTEDGPKVLEYNARFGDPETQVVLPRMKTDLVEMFEEINGFSRPDKLIVLFDEIDAIALDRTSSNDHREMGRATSTLLKCFDRVNENIVIVATTNLYQYFDKALLRRFDSIIDFDRYTDEDLIEVAEKILDKYLNKLKLGNRDIRLFRKIMKLSKEKLYPGDLKNVIRTSVAFSDIDDGMDYFRRLYDTVCGEKPTDLKKLQEQGFTIREIEILTKKSKSSVSRKLKDGE